MSVDTISPLRMLKPLDWVFVLLAWASVWYFFANIFEWIKGSKGDIMPLVAGVPIVIVGWWALRLGIQIKDAVNRLGDGAGLMQATAETIEAFHQDLQHSVLFWSIVLATLVGLVMAVGFVVSVILSIIGFGNLGQVMAIGFSGVYFSLQMGWEPINSPLLGLAMIGGGIVVGLLLGRLVGYGKLNKIMERRGIRLSGLTTPQARSAMRGLQHVFEFAVVSTMLCCHWFAGWWVGWSLGMPYYRDWWILTLPLWMISLSVFIFSARQPARAFHRRLDELYGGAEARRALEQQLAEAQEDRTKLNTMEMDRRRRAELAELDVFIADLADRHFRSPLLNPTLLDVLIAWNIGLMVIPWWFGEPMGRS